MSKAKEYRFENGVKFNERGEELMDATPAVMPVNFKRPEPLADMIRRMVKTQVSQLASNRGLESFDDADDFNVPDDPVDPESPYEEEFEGMDLPAVNEPKNNTKRVDEALKKVKADVAAAKAANEKLAADKAAADKKVVDSTLT